MAKRSSSLREGREGEAKREAFVVKTVEILIP